MARNPSAVEPLSPEPYGSAVCSFPKRGAVGLQSTSLSTTEMWFRSETSKVRSRRAAEDTPELYGSSFGGLACRNTSKMMSRCRGLISEVLARNLQNGEP